MLFLFLQSDIALIKQKQSIHVMEPSYFIKKEAGAPAQLLKKKGTSAMGNLWNHSKISFLE
jgi:hypothetical protein